VEGGTAVLFVALTCHFGAAIQLPAFLFLAAIGVAMVMIEVDLRRLPDSIVLMAYLGAALLLMPAGADQTTWWPVARALLGCGGLSLLYFTLALAYPDGANFGDSKLAGLLGFFLGWLSWGAVLMAGLGGLVIAVAAGSLRARRASTQRHVSVSVALAPCLGSAACIAVFAATPLTHWYSSLFGAS
jgi:leader peptidase (prepilin peptidase)/N-methyltransferase